MNKITLFVLGALVIIVALIIFLGGERALEEPDKAPNVSDNTEEASDVTNEGATVPIAASQGKDWGVDEKTETFLKKSMADPDYEWKQPINFFGKVVTLDGQALEGVTVEFGWTALSGYEKRTVESDASGQFDLTGVRGKTMTVKLEKDGYDWFIVRTQRQFEFAEPYAPNFHEANPDNPLIYYMQERPDAEPLHAWKTKSGIIHAGEGPTYYNYITGRFSKEPGKDCIQMKLQIDPPDEQNAKPYNWTLSLSGANYGFYQTDDHVSSVAPEDGYSGQVDIGKSADDKDWFNRRTYQVFFKNDSGNYGYLWLSPRVNKENQKVNITLDSYFNPSGSRALVFSSQKRIR